MTSQANERVHRSKRMHSGLLFFMFLLAASQGALAEPRINEKREYYDIRGRSESELKSELNSKGVYDGRMNDAYTKWYVRWNYGYQSGPDGCSLKEVRTSADINIKLPRWKNENDGPADVREKWSRFIKALEEHENGHLDFGVKTATEIDEALLHMPAYPDCEQMGNAANDKANEILGKYLAEEKAYDAQTNHGVTQGAVFP